MQVVILNDIADEYFFSRALGAYQLTRFIESRGFSCQVVDFITSWSEQELTNFFEQTIGPETLALGISSTFLSQAFGTVVVSDEYTQKRDYSFASAIRNLKSQYPNLKIVMGGALADYEGAYDNSQDYIDLYIKSFAENEFLHLLYQLKGLAGDETKFDIGKWNFQFREHDSILPNETLPIEISRGCIFSCKFCQHELKGKKALDYLKSKEAIASEIAENYRNFGTRNYFIIDDTFNDSIFKIQNFAEAVQKSGVDINYTCYLRIDLLDKYPELIPILKESGLKAAFFGIESLKHSTAIQMGKAFGGDRMKNLILKVNDLWKGEIYMHTSLIIGLPGESLPEIEASAEWMYSQGPNISATYWPLSINSSSRRTSKSFLEKHPEKYGYRFEASNPFLWTNDQMNFDQALQLRQQFRKKYARQSRLTGWNAFSLMNYGYSLKEVLEKPVFELPWDQYRSQKKEKVKAYQSQLLQMKGVGSTNV